MGPTLHVFCKVYLPKIVTWVSCGLAVVVTLFSIGGIGLGSYVWTALRPWNNLVQSAANRWPNQHTTADNYCSPFGLYVHFGIALVVVSAVLHVSALLGCVGSFKRVNSLVSIETWMFSFLIVVLSMLSVALYFVETEQMLVAPLQASMTTYIANGTNEFTSKWNSVQSQFVCCGVYGPDDWTQFDNSTFPTADGYKVPSVCCDSILPPYSDNLTDCLKNPDSPLYHPKLVGCYTKATGTLEHAKMPGIYTLLTLVGIMLTSQLVGLVMVQMNHDLVADHSDASAAA